MKIKGNPALKQILKREKEGKVKIKGNPKVKELLEKKEKKGIRGEDNIVIKGSIPAQLAMKEYYRRLKERGEDVNGEDIRDKYKGVAKIPVPRGDWRLPVKGKRKRKMVFRKHIRLDFFTMRLVRMLSRVMGISQSDFIRRAIVSYAYFVYNLLPRDDREKVDKGEV